MRRKLAVATMVAVAAAVMAGTTALRARAQAEAPEAQGPVTAPATAPATQPATRPADVPEPPRRFEVPTGAKLAEAEALMAEVFKADLALRTPNELVAVSRRLRAAAEKAADEPASLWVLLRESRDRAQRGGDVPAAIEAHQEMLSRFKVDASVTAEFLTRATKGSPLPAPDAAALATFALDRAEELAEADEPAQAVTVVELAAPCVIRAREPALSARLSEARARLKAQANSHAAAEVARRTLRTMPDDRQAHLALGRHLAIYQQRWRDALPHLAAGSDPGWRAAAAAELADPADAAETVKVADLWWDLAVKEPAATRLPVLERAVELYRLALPEAKGLLAARVEQRLAQAATMMRAATPGGGAAAAAGPAHGNVGRATVIALPTASEMARLKQMLPSRASHARAGHLFVHPHQELEAQLLLRLTANPETWSEADFLARLEAEASLLAATSLDPATDPQAQLQLLRTPFEVFVASAPSPEKLRARLATIEQFMSRRRRAGAVNRFIEQRMEEGLEAHATRHRDKYPTFAARLQFLNAIAPPPRDPRVTTLKEYRDQLAQYAADEAKDAAAGAARFGRHYPPPPQGLRQPRPPVVIQRNLSAESRVALGEAPAMSELTRKELPTEAELEALASAPDSKSKRRAYDELTRRVWHDLETWNAADFLARSRAMEVIEALYHGQPPPDNSVYCRMAVQRFPAWAQHATSVKDLRVRIAVLENQRFLAPGNAKGEADTALVSALGRYVASTANARAYADADAKLDLADQLQSQGVLPGPLEEFRQSVLWPRTHAAY